MDFHTSRYESRSPASRTVTGHHIHRRFLEPWVIGKAEIIVRGEHQNAFAIDDYAAILLAFDRPRFPVKPPFFGIIDLFPERGFLSWLVDLFGGIRPASKVT